MSRLDNRDRSHKRGEMSAASFKINLVDASGRQAGCTPCKCHCFALLSCLLMVPPQSTQGIVPISCPGCCTDSS